MSNIVPIDQASRAISPLMRERMAAGKGVNTNLQEGIRDAFPVLSIKGKVFRARISGQETAFIDPNTRQPIAFLDLILVNASPTLAKTYYVRGFTEGDMNPPDCWSLDSVRPDPSVANKVSPVCGTCPMNAFGSRMTDAGKAAKACADARRVAVMMPHQINDPQPMVLMLRVPQSSLKNLKAYGQLLDKHGLDSSGVVTRIAFDYQEAFPKLLFNFVQPLAEPEYRKVVDVADGPLVQGMLLTPDFDNAPSTQPVQQDNRLGGLAPQQGPVLATDTVIPGLTPAAGPASTIIELPDGRRFDTATGTFIEPEPEPVVAAPVLETVPSNLIELPDGQLFDPVNKVYVERKQPEVQMPQLDPAIITLPDGKFFNTATREFVVGPELGAKSIALEQPVKRERKARTKKEKEDDAQKQPEQQKATDPQPPVDNVGTTPEQPVDQPPQQANGTAEEGVKPVVKQASQSLSETLAKLLPPTTH